MTTEQYIKEMTPMEFVRLRRYCIDLVRDAVQTAFGKDMLAVFSETAARAELLPFTDPVVQTFMGIIGFRNSLQQEGSKVEYLAREAIHDLNECYNNSDKEWYSPRTEGYIGFFEPLSTVTVNERTPEEVVRTFFLYMWNRWCEDECKLLFGWNYRHFWDKWCHHCKQFRRGAVECFYAELDLENQRLLVERALRCYDEKMKQTENIIAEIQLATDKTPE